MEIAHKMVFGYGYETWEWTIATPIRSTLHPFLYAIGYWLLSFFHIDTSFLVAYLPRLIQGLLLALTDYYVYNLAKDILKDRFIAQMSMLLHLASWFVNFGMVRTLSNSVETTLIVIMYYYWTKISSKYTKYDTIVAILYTFTFFMRSTSGIVCATLIILQILKHGFTAIKNLFKAFFIAALPTIGLIVLIDSLYYGSFQIPMLSFLRVNVIEGISLQYGSHSTYWYLIAGLPFILLSYLPFAFHGFVRAMHNVEESGFFYIITSYFTVMSMLTHKEERQIFPVLPFFIISAAYSLSILKTNYPRLGLAVIGVAIGIQVIFLILANTFYRVGSLPVMDELRLTPDQELKGIYFLTDCHATPFYSHIHRYFHSHLLEI
jgi:phosphatidylinositol glycan class B